jgi:prolipoprotein diacylglyceryltransferase
VSVFNVLGVFPLFVGLGTGVGLSWIALRAHQKSVLLHLETGIAAICGGIIGGRAGYVLVNWAYFSQHPLDIVQLFLGGLSWPGVALGATLGLWLFARLWRIAFLETLDIVLPLAGTLAVSAWLAVWLEGSVYGVETSSWLALYAKDEWGQVGRRLPVQILGTCLPLAILWWVDRQPNLQLPAGKPAIIFGAGFSVMMLVISFLRGDPAPTWQGIHLDAWAAMFIVVICLAGLFLLNQNSTQQ